MNRNDKRGMCKRGVVGMAMMGACVAVPAAASTPVVSATPVLDLRLRYEEVQQDSASRDATALTLRTRLGYASASWNGLSAFADFEHIADWVDDYAPERAGYPVVADPAGSELNQAALRYAGVPGVTATVGRSRLVLDNARWVGNVGWRQNEQTFDGVFLDLTSIKNLRAQLAWITRVNTIVGTNQELDAPLLNLAWSPSTALCASAYAYLLDYDDAATPDLDTHGLRLSGKLPVHARVSLRYAAEYAQQQAETTAADFDTDYALAELGAVFGAFAVTLAHERLGSDDGAFALQTPLGTRHAFQGWADVFLQTPATGVRDTWLGVDGSLRQFKLSLRYHELLADQGGADYGNEIDLSATLPLYAGPYGGLSATAKFARYSADDFGADTDKLWLQLDYRL
ncbi:hypothetical protein [Sinimarinibacterium thermocellulolyticum]|uniref:Alginate export domain-containing protein n=1 Tax=Sinimarinibacterium thermocellulolyticum TaxID=3170016 RepID=A0ABV2ADZ7_9GAMM